MAEMMKSEQFASVYVLESHFQYKDIGVVNIFNSPAGRAVVNQTVSPEKNNKINNQTFCSNKTSNPETAKFVLTPETLIDLKSNHFNNYPPPIDYYYPTPKGLKNHMPVLKPFGNLTKNFGSSNCIKTGFDSTCEKSTIINYDPFNQLDSSTSTQIGFGSFNNTKNGSNTTLDSTINKFHSSTSKKDGFDNNFESCSGKKDGFDNNFESCSSKKDGFDNNFETCSIKKDGFDNNFETCSIKKDGFDNNFERCRSKKNGFENNFDKDTCIQKYVDGFDSSTNINSFESFTNNNDCFSGLTSSLNGFETNLTDAAKSESILSNSTNHRIEIDSSVTITNGFNSNFDLSNINKGGFDFNDTNLTDEVKKGETNTGGGTNTGITRRSINEKLTSSNKDRKEQLERAKSLEEQDKKKRLEEVRLSDKVHSRSTDRNLAKERRFSDEKCDILRRIVSGFLGGWTTGSVVDIARWRKRKSSEELYREASLALGIPCELTDSCRCLECQCHYFDCGSDSDTSETSINLYDCDIEEMSYDQTSSNHNSDVVFYEDETNETCYSSTDRQISIDMPSDSDDDQNQREIARIFDNDNTENEEKEWNGGKSDRSAPAIFQDGDDLAPTIEIAAGTPVILDHLLNNPMTCALQ